jgi:hypothetical protein
MITEQSKSVVRDVENNVFIVMICLII